MINGYWTALATIILAILLITGWSKWIDQKLKLAIIIPAAIIIWCSVFFRWKRLTIAIGSGLLSLEPSFIAISALILLYDLLSDVELDLPLIMLYSVTVAISIVMVRALTVFAPWVGATVAYWHLPLISGMMLGLLNARFSQLVLTVFCSWCVAEVLLIWQQGGEYNGHIGSLQWWDQVAISIAGVILIKIIVVLLQKFVLQITQLVGKRMKS